MVHFSQSAFVTALLIVPLLAIPIPHNSATLIPRELGWDEGLLSRQGPADSDGDVFPRWTSKGFFSGLASKAVLPQRVRNAVIPRWASWGAAPSAASQSLDDGFGRVDDYKRRIIVSPEGFKSTHIAMAYTQQGEKMTGHMINDTVSHKVWSKTFDRFNLDYHYKDEDGAQPFKKVLHEKAPDGKVVRKITLGLSPEGVIDYRKVESIGHEPETHHGLDALKPLQPYKEPPSVPGLATRLLGLVKRN